MRSTTLSVLPLEGNHRKHKHRRCKCLQRGLSSCRLLMKRVVLLQAVLTEPPQSHYLLNHCHLLNYGAQLNPELKFKAGGKANVERSTGDTDMCFTNLTVYSSLCANQCYLTLLTSHSAGGRSDYSTAQAAVQWDCSGSWIPGNLHVLMIWNIKELHGQHFQQVLLVIQATSTASPRES